MARIIFKKILRNWYNLFAVGTLLAILFMALGAPLISPYSPIGGNLQERLKPPLSTGHLLGTDTLGRICFRESFMVPEFLWPLG
jgi:peptide/nickel transport system permease protein